MRICSSTTFLYSRDREMHTHSAWESIMIQLLSIREENRSIRAVRRESELRDKLDPHKHTSRSRLSQPPSPIVIFSATHSIRQTNVVMFSRKKMSSYRDGAYNMVILLSVARIVFTMVYILIGCAHWPLRVCIRVFFYGESIYRAAHIRSRDV